MGPGTGMGGGRANLTDDQIKQMQAEQNAFQAATEDIRLQLNEKRQALHTELDKQTPDVQQPRPFKRKSPIFSLNLTRSDWRTSLK